MTSTECGRCDRRLSGECARLGDGMCMPRAVHICDGQSSRSHLHALLTWCLHSTPTLSM